MSTINTNVVDYLHKIETLTNTNLQILKTLNDSFFTRKNHLYAEVDNTTYVIPSFLSLENKINMLQENFENLVHAPETGEAYFSFDGNSRAIEVKKYSHVPDHVVLPVVKTFDYEANDIFKDFLTPVPYINLELPQLPNDVVEVNVKKIVPKSESLKELFKSKLAYIDASGETQQTLYHQSVNDNYGSIYKNLLNYTEDKDYVEYDTIYKLPVRKNIGTGKYVIESVVSDIINDDLEEIITLKIRTDLKDTNYFNTLTYKLFDDTIEKPIKAGDYLINYNGTGKLQVIDVKPATSTLTVRVVNGEYLNFLGTDSYDTNNETDIHDFSKLRYYASIDFDADKYIKVPLEEDQYVFIAVAAVNSRMNIQSSWGTGLIIDTYSLKDAATNSKSFKTYYDANVKNIGDVLFEMTSMITSPITELSEDAFKEAISIKPIANSDALSVMQINKHLNNSDTVKNIRDAYNQKKISETELSEVQTKINDINQQLASISFDDTTGIRAAHSAQLAKLNNKKNELLSTINSAINNISLNVNSAEIPIENAKYRIRGFYVPELSNKLYNERVIGIKVQYRYKNMSSELGTATSISGLNGETYIYSDWNNMSSFNKDKIANCIDGIYTYKYEANNENKNEPSYNQIDIPISQGESVDIRIKVIYDFGQPYITVSSDWSDIINIPFPSEFAKDVPILTIIEENNNDIETNRFNNILINSGIDSHVKDMINDQNTIYYHKPDNIASGFYTEERRIIPLKDKLLSMSNDIALLKSDIEGAFGNCRVSLSIADNDTLIYSDRENTITLEPYNNFAIETASAELSSSLHDGAYTIENGVVSTLINVSIANTGDTAMKLYSLFPGNRNVNINDSTSTYVNKANYSTGSDEGVWFKYQHGSDETMLQTQNQYITFRINDAWTGKKYYDSNTMIDTENMQNSNGISSISVNDKLGMIIYPYVATKYGLCIDSDAVRSYVVINPGDEIVVPMMCSFIAADPNSVIMKTISFDLRTSLYDDPINYTFTVIGKNTTTMQDQLTVANKKRFWNRLTNPVKYSTTIK